MTGLRLDLANPDHSESIREYIEKHLAPTATELHRLLNELLAPGSTAEEYAFDMVPDTSGDYFRRLTRRLENTAKRVVFDGSEYFSLPKDLLKSKQAKVQLTAVLYVKGRGEADFRLVRDDGDVIKGSSLRVIAEEPNTFIATLPFGDQPGCISPDRRTYYIEAGVAKRQCLPVCRRFSLSFVYI